jgi:hypothetical protein
MMIVMDPPFLFPFPLPPCFGAFKGALVLDPPFPLPLEVLGAAVGPLVGPDVGPLVGPDVGLLVGSLEGSGDVVGPLEGAGDVDGASVGGGVVATHPKAAKEGLRWKGPRRLTVPFWTIV